MATAEDILKKHTERKRKNFQPVIRRVWDDISSINSSEKSTTLNPEKKIGNENRDKYRNNISTDIGTIRNRNGNQYENNISTDIETEIGSENRNENWVRIEPKIDEIIEKKIIKILRKTTGYQKDIMEQITAHIKSMSDNTNVIDIPIETLAIRIKSTKDV